MSQTRTASTKDTLATKFQYNAIQVYAGIANMMINDLNAKGQEAKAPLVLKDAMKKVAHWLSNEETKDRKWLMLFGKSGNGKSSVLKGIDDLIARLKSDGYGDKAAFSYKHISARELTNLYTSDRATFNYYMNINLLLIDDLGTEPKTVFEFGNPLEPMKEVFTYRYDNRNSKNLSMVFTTNIDPNDIEERYGSRIFSRFCETCQSVKFEGEDFRKQVEWREIEKGCPF